MIEDLNEPGIIRQIFQAVEFLHKDGVVHRGPRSPSVPNYIAATAPFCPDGEAMREQAAELVIKMDDFGCTFRPGTADILVSDGGPPRWLRAPECIISEFSAADTSLPVPAPWSFQSDIWTLGCSLVELYSRSPNQTLLFAGSDTPSLGSIIRDGQTLGSISEVNCDESSVAANWLLLETSVRTARVPKTPGNKTDKQRDTKDVEVYLSLVKRMLRWNANDRISADQALKSHLFQGA
ncbi:kinase-like domain-containing protein [Mycena rosella]|uniref:Kinase-like domain-containing protein n=1 Tax=Mycena rosella TaxID=1033263 RepID=A0AAD7CU18_MYCRO|nr:kinase-like domain-containing protein [Mycena rosella]